ncbi:hypothetical protein FACS1894186_5990 [Alphaproteobacteria bacterium]|nr:hypothetical protein FACS1894186_5990 [Alphaproteobacteria bacterium]
MFLENSDDYSEIDLEPVSPVLGLDKTMTRADFEGWGEGSITYFKRGHYEGKEVWEIHNSAGDHIGVTVNLDVAKELIRRYNITPMMVQ